ncbi:RAxF-45 family protein [Ectobacillus panaciterrae]|nr:RAxF-45 family protein [Ectobacillus panaciterrae]
MNYFLTTRAQFLDFIYICRVIFHVAAVNGISLSFNKHTSAVKK